MIMVTSLPIISGRYFGPKLKSDRLIFPFRRNPAVSTFDIGLTFLAMCVASSTSGFVTSVIVYVP